MSLDGKEVRGVFLPEERVILGLIDRQSNEDFILKPLREMARAAPEKLKKFTDKEDFKGRTLLVRAIRGNYEQVVKTLLVNL